MAATSIVRLTLLAGLAAGLLQPALAQTARIAHFSHGGSGATLAADEALDNFGLYTEERPERFTRLNDSIAQVEGQQRVNNGPWQPLKWQQQYHSAHDAETVRQAVKQLRKQYPDAKFVGFEPKPRGRHKKMAAIPVGPAPSPPHDPGPALAVALLLALGGAGWLLGERRPAQPQAA
jgi:hypothetical protein